MSKGWPALCDSLLRRPPFESVCEERLFESMKTLLRSSVNWLPLGLRRRIRRLPGVGALQRWVVGRLLNGESFVHTINAGPAAGLRIEVDLPADKAIWAGTYEYEFASAISSAVSAGDVCLDIGGYRGYMAGVMALAGASQVFVFEPLPENQRAITRLCELNPALPIELKRIAVSGRDGPMWLDVMPDLSMGKLETSPFQTGAASTRRIEISTSRIDSMIENGEILSPGVMKIDVEGAELEVLRGARTTLGQSRPVLFLEAQSAALEEACRAELTSLGYKVSCLGHEVSGEEQTRHLIARHAYPR